MHNYYHKQYLFFSIVFACCTNILCTGCSSRVEAPSSLSTNNIPGTSISANKTNKPAPINYFNSSKQCQIDLEQENEIEKSCLQAWRKCLAGNKKEAIQQLKVLATRYPNSSSVMFMTGQVMERSGNKQEAIKYYEKALHDSDFAAMSLFKLAESLRTTGNVRQAISRYQELIRISPESASAHLGLAKAWQQLNPSSPEIKKELQIALSIEPQNTEAKKMLAKE